MMTLPLVLLTSFGRNADGDAVTGIYHVQRPQQPEWAVNMEYSDEQDQLMYKTKSMTL